MTKASNSVVPTENLQSTHLLSKPSEQKPEVSQEKPVAEIKSCIPEEITEENEELIEEETFSPKPACLNSTALIKDSEEEKDHEDAIEKGFTLEESKENPLSPPLDDIQKLAKDLKEYADREEESEGRKAKEEEKEGKVGTGLD